MVEREIRSVSLADGQLTHGTITNPSVGSSEGSWRAWGVRRCFLPTNHAHNCVVFWTKRTILVMLDQTL
jgi:hypothetical protein